MMFVFGGIPDIYWERLKKRAARELKGHLFTGVPLRPTPNGSYDVTKEHCEGLIENLVRFVHGRSQCLDDGLAVVMLLRPWEAGGFAGSFFPFALYEEVPTNQRPVRSGMEADRIANIQISDLLSKAKRLFRPARVVKAELQSRMKRSPVLLPVRHFESDTLLKLLRHIGEEISEADDPEGFILQQCAYFEQIHPFEKRIKRRGRFISRRGVYFTTPGRAMHGTRRDEVGEGHNERCLLNAKLRLGGPIIDGFHYDCTKGDRAYSGEFPNCHDSRGNYRGNPHLNVYPNDFIRS